MNPDTAWRNWLNAQSEMRKRFLEMKKAVVDFIESNKDRFRLTTVKSIYASESVVMLQMPDNYSGIFYHDGTFYRRDDHYGDGSIVCVDPLRNDYREEDLITNSAFARSVYFGHTPIPTGLLHEIEMSS